ncbi:hypothetical protein [Bacillus sp. CGMCC 1.16541]|nr:hypothetical protein [Bacillus sp. CGMCC 1.16541]
MMYELEWIILEEWRRLNNETFHHQTDVMVSPKEQTIEKPASPPCCVPCC